MPVNPRETTNRLVPSYAPYTADDLLKEQSLLLYLDPYEGDDLPRRCPMWGDEGVMGGEEYRSRRFRVVRSPSGLLYVDTGHDAYGFLEARLYGWTLEPDTFTDAPEPDCPAWDPDVDEDWYLSRFTELFDRPPLVGDSGDYRYDYNGATSPDRSFHLVRDRDTRLPMLLAETDQQLFEPFDLMTAKLDEWWFTIDRRPTDPDTGRE